MQTRCDCVQDGGDSMGRSYRSLCGCLAPLRACVVSSGRHDRQSDEWFARAAGAPRLAFFSRPLQLQLADPRMRGLATVASRTRRTAEALWRPRARQPRNLRMREGADLAVGVVQFEAFTSAMLASRFGIILVTSMLASVMNGSSWQVGREAEASVCIQNVP